jgi:hypothetical protein
VKYIFNSDNSLHDPWLSIIGCSSDSSDFDTIETISQEENSRMSYAGFLPVARPPDNSGGNRQDTDLLTKGCIQLKSRHLTKLKVTVFRIYSMEKEKCNSSSWRGNAIVRGLKLAGRHCQFELHFGLYLNYITSLKASDSYNIVIHEIICTQACS